MTIAMASSFYVERVDDLSVLCFTVRSMVEQNYEAVSDELLEFVTLVSMEDHIRVVAELSRVESIDDLGLAMLQAFSDSIRDAGGRLILCRVQPAVLAAIRQSDMDCEVSRTCGEALTTFSNSANFKGWSRC